MINNSYINFEINQIASDKVTRDILPTVNSLGDFKEVTGKDAIITAIRNLLMTPLGRYPFDPEYGSNLYKQIFEFMDSTTQKNILYELKNRIEMYEDRVSVDDVIIKFDKDKKTAVVTVEFTILNDENKTKLSIFVKNYETQMLQDSESLMTSIWG